MKNGILILICLFCFTMLTQSQTEIWRFPGIHRQVCTDELGNTYLIRGPYATPTYDWHVPDTLYKLDPTGAIGWSVPLRPGEKQMLLNGSGIYLYINYGTYDSLFYFDLNGTLCWRYNNPLPHSFVNNYQGTLITLDPQGNVYFKLRTYDPVAKQSFMRLTKLDKDGNVIYDIDVTQPNLTDSTHNAGYMGPYVTEAGNFWVVFYTSSETRTTTKKGTVAISKGRVEALYYNGTTGNLLLRKKTFDGLFISDKRFNDGSYHYIVRGYVPVYDQYTISKEILVGWTTYETYESKCNSQMKCKENILQDWRVQTVDPQGGMNTYKFKGSGKFVEGASQYRENILYNVYVGNNNSVYLYGTMTNKRNKIILEKYALFKLNLDTKRITWKIIDRNDDDQIIFGGYEVSLFYHKGEDKILSPIGPRDIVVINADGKVCSNKLTFTDFMLVGLFSNPETIASAYGHAGYLYAVAQTGISDYQGITYSLPQLTFSAQPANTLADEFDSEPSAFDLGQNYPNPFNPTTTIDFELASAATVTVMVFNTLGQEVATLANREEFGEGVNSVDFNASGLPSGVYYYRIMVDGEEPGMFNTKVKKMLLMK